MARGKQLPLPTRNWGGKRKGAGAKRRLPRLELPHRRRPSFEKALPQHVTLRTAPDVYSLRSRRSLNAMRWALWAGSDRFGVRIVQLSIMGNHIHLLVEAPDHVALGRAMKGLGVRLARKLNEMMGRTGRVIGDRYHSRRLKTPTEVRSAMHYIRNNHRHHGVGSAEIDEYSSDGLLKGILPAPKLWLVTAGWRRGRVIRSPAAGAVDLPLRWTAADG